jgi:hypothetical protein
MVSCEVPSLFVTLWNPGQGYCRDLEIPCPVRTRAHNAAGEAKTVIRTTNEWTGFGPGFTEDRKDGQDLTILDLLLVRVYPGMAVRGSSLGDQD